MSVPRRSNEAEECSDAGVGVRPGEKDGMSTVSLNELGTVGEPDEVPSPSDPWASMTDRADGPPACLVEGEDSPWDASVGTALVDAGWLPMGTGVGLDDEGPEKEAGCWSE